MVLLDFWTFCCINCLHVLPELAALEAKFEGQPFAVVGIHSAKFDNEKVGLLIVSQPQTVLTASDCKVKATTQRCCWLPSASTSGSS